MNANDLYGTPIAATVNALQDEGRNVWITGFTPEGTHALVIDADNGTASIAPVGTVSGIGRWECSKTHYNAHQSLYNGRFPLR